MTKSNQGLALPAGTVRPEVGPRLGKGGRSLAFYAILFVFLLVVLLPIYYIFLTAFAPGDKLFTQPLSYLPQSLKLCLYHKIFSTPPIGGYMLNTIFLATVSTVIPLIFIFLAAYAIARLQ